MKFWLTLLFMSTGFSASAFGDCQKTDRGNGLYSIEGATVGGGSFGYQTEAVCGCDVSDEIVTGGCYASLPPTISGTMPPVRITTNIPNFRNGQWIWVCGAEFTEGAGYYRLLSRAVCRRGAH